MENCIVIIDSGLGGLSVLKRLYNKLQNVNYVYFADTKNLPYGQKTKKELMEITTQNINNIIKEYNPIIIVFGCNTIGTTIFCDIKKKYEHIKMFALTPNITSALKYNCKNILVLGTTQTIKNIRKTQDYQENKSCIILCKMPLLATKVENYIQNPVNIMPYLKDKLTKYKKTDCIVLGCSHYYFVKNELKSLFKRARIIDGTSIVTSKIILFLKQNKINFSCKPSKSNSKIKLVITSNVKNKSVYKQIIKNIIKSN